MTITPTKRPTNSGPSVGKVPAEAGIFFFAASDPAKRQHGNDIGEAAEQHHEAERRVEPERVAVQAGEGRAVVGVGRRIGVDHLGQAVRPAVVHTVERGLQAAPRRR